MHKFCVAALPALKNRERLQDHDSGIADFERKVSNAVLQQSTADSASHVFALLIRKPWVQILIIENTPALDLIPRLCRELAEGSETG